MTEIEVGNVTRYCKPSSLENGVPKSSAFERRQSEKYLSVYWLDFFQKQTEKENVIEVKNYMEENTGFNCKSSGSFAILNIEQSKKYILEQLSEEIFYQPQNLPHCGIFHDAGDLLIAKLLSQCVRNNYLVKDIDDRNSSPSISS